MKKLFCLFLGCLLLGSLVSCNKNHHGDLTARSSSAIASKTESLFSPNTEPEGEPGDGFPLYRAYADTLPAPVSPVLENGSYHFGDRTLLLKYPAKNGLEQLVAEYHYHQLSAEFEKLSGMVEKTENMQIEISGMEQGFKEGVFPLKPPL